MTREIAKEIRVRRGVAGDLDTIVEFNSAMAQISESDSDLGKEVRYDLAEAHLAKEDETEALHFFEEIMSVDIGYRDVSQRVDQIRNKG